MNNCARAAEIALRQISSRFQDAQKPWARSFHVATAVEAAAVHRVLLSFARQENGWWFCRVHNDDLGKTPLSKLITFRDAAKVVEIARRGRGLVDIASRDALDEAVALGRGQIMLMLDNKQYEAVSRKSLRVPPAPSRGTEELRGAA